MPLAQMITKLLMAWCLVAICVTVHAIGLVGAIRWVSRSPALPDSRFWPPTWMLIRITGWLIAVHLVEIAVWALFYWGQECFSDAEATWSQPRATG